MTSHFDDAALIRRRRNLHRIPEVSFQEFKTQQYVLDELLSMGLKPRPIAKTGVIVRLGPQEGDAIALRADLDALPLTEKTGLEFASKHVGVHHACGHDGHTAMLLTVAESLATWLNADDSHRLKLGVVLLFQPAEEGLHGARLMVQEGCLKDVKRIFGTSKPKL
jgi:amidohydrolase